jgi:hypothetical protein
MNRFPRRIMAVTRNARLINALIAAVIVFIFGCGQGVAASASHPISVHPEVAAAIEVLDAWITATVASRAKPLA